MFSSIRWKLTASYISLTILTVAVVGILFFVTVHVRTQAMEQDYLRETGDSIRKQLATLITSKTASSQIAELARATALLRSVHIRVIAADGSQLVAADPGDFEKSSPAPTSTNLSQTALPNPSVIATLGRLLEEEKSRRKTVAPPEEPVPDTGVVRIPISADADLGYLELSDGPDLGEPVMQAAGVGFAVAAVGSLLASILLGLLVGRKLTVPIADLAVAVRRMGQGALSVRADPVGKDEIAQLAVDFNGMAENLERAVTGLERERDTLKQFVADASHELRTPVTALTTFHELLEGPSGEKPERRQEFLGEARVQLGRMKRIINELIELSRLDAGMVTLSREETTLREIVTGARDLLPNDHQVGFEMDDATGSVALFCDTGRMVTVFRNLFENSVRAMKREGTIRISAEADAAGVTIEVGDSGPGVSEDQLPHLFKRFYRPPNTDGPGSGLGLAIVKSVVESHGGSVAARTDGGLVLRLRLPGPGAGNIN